MGRAGGDKSPVVDLVSLLLVEEVRSVLLVVVVLCSTVLVAGTVWVEVDTITVEDNVMVIV